MADWLRAYTAGAAYAGGQENERGSISAGLRADLVILATDPGSAGGYSVDETWISGTRVWRSVSDPDGPDRRGVAGA